VGVRTLVLDRAPTVGIRTYAEVNQGSIHLPLLSYEKLFMEGNFGSLPSPASG